MPNMKNILKFLLFTFIFIATNVDNINAHPANRGNFDIGKLKSLDVFRLNIFKMSEEDSIAYYSQLEKQTELQYEQDSINKKYPSYCFYNKSWDKERLNPYRTKIDSMPDSIMIDCSKFVFPTESNRITSQFGERGYRFHYGIDLGIKYGDTIRASFDGKVRIVDYERRGFGHYVVIRHDNGLESIMAHMSRVLVKEDDEVKAGEPIGLGGSTGRSTGPHLHLEYRFLGNAFDPSKLVDFNSKSAIASDDNKYLMTIEDTFSHKSVLAQMSQARYHRVKSGETLSHIARRYGTSVSALCKLNKIRQTSILQIGQKIRYR